MELWVKTPSFMRVKTRAKQMIDDQDRKVNLKKDKYNN